jgi:hypothetical protein
LEQLPERFMVSLPAGFYQLPLNGSLTHAGAPLGDLPVAISASHPLDEGGAVFFHSE